MSACPHCYDDECECRAPTVEARELEYTQWEAPAGIWHSMVDSGDVVGFLGLLGFVAERKASTDVNGRFRMRVRAAPTEPPTAVEPDTPPHSPPAEDVQTRAEELWNSLETPYQDGAPLDAADSDVARIAAALQAERERVTAIMRRQVERDWPPRRQGGVRNWVTNLSHEIERGEHDD